LTLSILKRRFAELRFFNPAASTFVPVGESPWPINARSSGTDLSDALAARGP
jgi:hypothetical protein